MIRKILLLALIVIFVALSVTLYNQYEIIPNSNVEDLGTSQREAEKLTRAWTADERQALNVKIPPAPKEEEQSKDEPQEQASQDQDEPVTEQPAATDASTEESATPPETAAAPDASPDASPDTKGDATPQAGPAKPDTQAKNEADTILGEPELTPPLPDQQDKPEAPATQASREDPEEMSKAEKALRRSGGWAMDQTRRADSMVNDVEQELDQEKDTGERMKLTRKDEIDPKSRVDELVTQIEKRSLKKVEEADAPKPQKVAEAPEPAPEPKPKKRKLPQNNVSDITLTSDAQAVFITINTDKPIWQYTYFQMRNPRRFVLDLHGEYERPAAIKKVPPNAMVKDMRTGLHTTKLRVVADLLPEPTIVARVEKRSDKTLVIELRPKQ